MRPSGAKLRNVHVVIYVYLYIYFYWIYAAKIWRSYVSRIYTLLQGRTVRGPIVHFFQGGQLGPGAQLSGAQLSTF